MKLIHRVICVKPLAQDVANQVAGLHSVHFRSVIYSGFERTVNPDAQKHRVMTHRLVRDHHYPLKKRPPCRGPCVLYGYLHLKLGSLTAHNHC